jgi:molybdopterin-guanine dinucleotide biosynthesis protein A
MGQDKALLPVEGRAMARRVADALLAAGASSVRAVGGDAARLGALGLLVQPDEHPGDGPLPATITALRTAVAPVVFVASCDLVAPDPAAMAATVHALRGAPDALGAVPRDSTGTFQWTHAAWRREAVATLEEAYAAGMRSLRRAGAGLPLVLVDDLPARALLDADDPGDLPGPG